MYNKIESLRTEFANLTGTDKQAVANSLAHTNEIFATLEEQGLGDTIALLGPELGEEAFRLGCDPNTTEEQIEAFLATLPTE